MDTSTPNPLLTTPALELVAAELRRVQLQLGYTPERDDQYTKGELTDAALAYLVAPNVREQLKIAGSLPARVPPRIPVDPARDRLGHRPVRRAPRRPGARTCRGPRMSLGARVILATLIFAGCVFIVFGKCAALIVLAYGAGVLCGGWLMWLVLECPTGDEGAP